MIVVFVGTLFLLGIAGATVSNPAKPKSTFLSSNSSFKNYVENFGATTIWEKQDREIKQKNRNATRKHIPSSNSSFKNYLKKFSPTTIWEKLDREIKQKNRNATRKHILEEMIDRVDETDEILTIPLPNVKKSRRTDTRRDDYPKKEWFDMPWTPRGSPDVKWYSGDPHWLRPRFWNLMLQSIYQARDQMVIMQKLREKYRKHSLYRMGFLTSKMDHVCRSLSGFAFKALKACVKSYYGHFERLTLYELVDSEERLLNMWFDLDLYKDLHDSNYETCVQMLTNTIRGRKAQKWYKDKYVFD